MDSDKLTISGIKIPEKIEEIEKIENGLQAGEYPYTRGIYSRMYRQRLWTMRQYSGYSSAQGY